MNRDQLIQTCVRAACLLLFIQVSGSAEALKYVVPAGLDDEEGNSSSDPSYEGPFRCLGIYYQEEFDGLPETHRLISGFRLRPDESVEGPGDVFWEDATWAFSTSEREELTDSFNDNHGPDRLVVIDETDLTLRTKNERSADGPKTFDYQFSFEQPFRYDPMRGNLIWEAVAPHGYQPPLHNDGQDGNEIVSNCNTDLGDHADLFFIGNLITQFVFSRDGDFDGNGDLDVHDVNSLAEASKAERQNVAFDVNRNGSVEAGDVTAWVKDLKNSGIGDTNLDGEFGSGDLVMVFRAGKYEQDALATWSEGDWNADDRFGTGDLVAAFEDGGYELGPRPNMNAVPQPASLLMILAALAGIAIGRRHLSR